MKLRTQLWLPTLALGVTIVIVGVVAVTRTQGLVETAGQRTAALQDKLHAAHEWSGLTRTNAVRTVAVLRSADPTLEATMKEEMARTSSRISEIQQRIESIADSDAEKRVLAEVATRRKAYIEARKDVVALKTADPQRAAAELDQRVMPALTAYLGAQDEFVKVQEAAGRDLSEQTGQERMRTVWGVIALMVTLLGAMAVATAVLVRRICGPMADVAGSADRIAAGDLSESIRVDRDDEIGLVLRALVGMQESLRRSVSIVRQSADSIQVASSEVASGNQDLSGRTEQTASSLQQTSSSMEHLTGTVRQTAESARTANQLASSAAEAAQRGGQVVEQVVLNMDEITASSRKIAEIISVIDGIAFQTNILALNAAVEAARAGEQGRGFAVVAGEVRNLAQRSANAAREIKSLIGASVDKVESGSRLVQDAGSTMNEIVASVQRVSDIIGEITAASTEQSSELGQINAAVTQLDQMTQQNAALVEESAAAASSLKDQAVRLIEAVQVFRFDPQGAAPARPKAAPVAIPARASTAIPSAGSQMASVPPFLTTAPATPTVMAPLAAPAATPARTTASGMATSTAADSDWETF